MLTKTKYLFAIVLTVFTMNVSAVEYVEEDPLIEINRGIFYFNHMVFTLYVKPATKVYNLLPLPVKESVNNFVQNLRTVPYTVNSILQGKMAQALRNGTRFVINTTAGIFGLFDVAAEIGLPQKIETLGDTLYAWGWKESSYFVVPLIGPATIRDAWGYLGDYFMVPSAYFPPEYWNPYYFTVLINTNYRHADVQDLVSIAGVNDYDFVRSSYLQHRHYELTGETLFGGEGDELTGPPD